MQHQREELILLIDFEQHKHEAMIDSMVEAGNFLLEKHKDEPSEVKRAVFMAAISWLGAAVGTAKICVESSIVKKSKTKKLLEDIEKNGTEKEKNLIKAIYERHERFVKWHKLLEEESNHIRSVISDLPPQKEHNA